MIIKEEFVEITLKSNSFSTYIITMINDAVQVIDQLSS